MLQAACADAVPAFLIFLHSLERQAERIAEFRLGHPKHQTAHAHSISDVGVSMGVVRPLASCSSRWQLSWESTPICSSRGNRAAGRRRIYKMEGGTGAAKERQALDLQGRGGDGAWGWAVGMGLVVGFAPDALLVCGAVEFFDDDVISRSSGAGTKAHLCRGCSTHFRPSN